MGTGGKLLTFFQNLDGSFLENCNSSGFKCSITFKLKCCRCGTLRDTEKGVLDLAIDLKFRSVILTLFLPFSRSELFTEDTYQQIRTFPTLLDQFRSRLTGLNPLHFSFSNMWERFCLLGTSRQVVLSRSSCMCI